MKSNVRILPSLFACALVIGLHSFSSTAPSQDTSANLQSAESHQFGHNTNWRTQSKLTFDTPPVIDWEIEAGFGRSQIVGRDGVIYVASGFEKKADGETTITTNLKAIDLATGETKWSYTQTDKMHDEQENFSGATIGPQATPAISGDRITMLSFTGQVTCLNINDGAEIWKKDLVDELGCDAVQFGFSSSPLVDPDAPENIYVLAGSKENTGPSQGLFCFNASNGEVNWVGLSFTFSYSTPVIAEFGGVKQFVITNRESVCGVEASTGRVLWEHKVAEQGLTNVPTPLVVDGSHLVISGQGCKGTRGLKIQNDNGTWKADEVWYDRKIQYFYTNWTKLTDRIVIGCTEKLFVAFDPIDGKVLGRWRGFSDGNVLLSNAGVWLLDGKGKLNFFKSDKNGLSLTQKYSVIKGRSWTPLMIVDDRMLVRADDRLACLSFVGAKGKTILENQMAQPKRFDFAKGKEEKDAVDPVELIFETFASKGQAAALDLYRKLRNQKPTPLTVEARLALANAAKEQGLTNVAEMVLNDALEDFPSSNEVKEALGK